MSKSVGDNYRSEMDYHKKKKKQRKTRKKHAKCSTQEVEKNRIKERKITRAKINQIEKKAK